MTWLDWVFLAILAISMLAGFLRGLVREALGLGAWIVALIASRMFAQPVADMLEGFIDHPDARLILAFVLVILAVILVCGVIIRLTNAAVEWAGMGFFNRLAGAGFGTLRGGAILILVTVVISLTPLAQLHAWQQAELRPSFEGLRDWAMARISDWERHDPETADELRSLSLPLELPLGKDDRSKGN
ncbi:membrane protein required for colicin V production [Modicisalibacter ilicicola DSM 19980]|uniref:Membrane protein required for colicin V production n=1 Tax=Modicisalibacter ilicicola DSM 19980 TaxID=1121942 RepID=A0A1M5BL66_9GAMM|nr:membrane protein required for colicin V production [Halomonas ilicicola DSM 19980]